MTRAYIRLDPQFDERKEAYPDGPYRALVACLCLSESQPARGRFRSVDYLKRLLGKVGRHVQFLLDHGDLTVFADGRVYVEGWDEWQEGDWKVGERVRRIRARRHGADNDASNGPGNGGVTPRVTPPRIGGGSGGDLAVTAERAPAVSDDEARGHLDTLKATMEGAGIPLPSKPNGKPHQTPSETEPEYVARLQRVADDPDEVGWKRDAARAQLEAMRVQP